MLKIRVLVADRSSADVEALIAILSADPEIEIVGVATTGRQAIDLVSKLRPDIAIISNQDVDNLEAIKQIMAYNPTPILILTDPDSESGKNNIFKAISMGALDVIEKPDVRRMRKTQDTRFKAQDSGLKAQGTRHKAQGTRHKGSEALSLESCALRLVPSDAYTELVETVKLLSRIKVVTHLAGRLEERRREEGRKGGREEGREEGRKVVAIAASTGGPSALAEILRGLPAGLGMGVVIVQHVAKGFSAGLADWLNKESEVTVSEARNGDRIEAGHAFLAPTGFHMTVTVGNRILLNETPPVAGHRPSADILFASVAKTYGRDSIGVILTGMGTDGAKGIVAIKSAGGKTIAQDEQSCVVFGMPRAAIETGAVDEIIRLDAISERVVQLCERSSLEHRAMREEGRRKDEGGRRKDEGGREEG